jgi:SnoaL-like domain
MGPVSLPVMTRLRISDAIRETALDPAGDLSEVLDKYYAPDYMHRNDGETMDRAAFAEMVAKYRGQIAGGSVTVLDEMYDGDRYAERHVYDITLSDGSRINRELYLFGTLAEDGRFRHITETGFDL